MAVLDHGRLLRHGLRHTRSRSAAEGRLALQRQRQLLVPGEPASAGAGDDGGGGCHRGVGALGQDVDVQVGGGGGAGFAIWGDASSTGGPVDFAAGLPAGAGSGMFGSSTNSGSPRFTWILPNGLAANRSAAMTAMWIVRDASSPMSGRSRSACSLSPHMPRRIIAFCLLTCPDPLPGPRAGAAPSRWRSGRV